MLNVTVTDRSKRYVSDLIEDDFRVFEDGRPQQITFFQPQALPLALVLLLDTSASMSGALWDAQKAAIRLIGELGPADVASVIAFDTSVRVLQPFTNDKQLLESAIRQTRLGRKTALYTALYVALKDVSRIAAKTDGDEPRRRALVVLSDGTDTSSPVAFQDLLDLAVRTDAAIYCIGLHLPEPDPGVIDDGRLVLRRLAQQTGGRAFFPAQPEYLSEIYGDITRELSSQYAVAYVSNNPRTDGRFRQIKVHVGRPGIVARTKPGYFAPTR